MKKGLKVAGLILLILLVAIAAFFAILTITEYKPADVIDIPPQVGDTVGYELFPGDSLRVVTWNIGYGALGDNADFFMDGGTGVRTADRARVESNMLGICTALQGLEPDLMFLQEVDANSTRSHRIDEREVLRAAFPEMTSTFATNYSVLYVPYPIPPIGHVDGGILTLSSYAVDSAERIQLPCPFKWPIRLGNLKRCLLVSRIPVQGTDKELVAVNLHLEAYDDGEGKAAQTAQLVSFLLEEADKGNYVIAGGDFNQIFSNVDDGTYAVREGLWAPGVIDESAFDERFTLLMDNRHPTCRSLDQPYVGADRDSFQYYMIDGFIVSSNLTVQSLETQDLGFVCSDHNPVVLDVVLNQ